MPALWSDNLTGKHLQIAGSSSKRIAILAGPGTGKTSYGLLRRIMRLLQDQTVLPEQILFLTFTRTAAEDFKDKLDTMGVENYEKVEASTIHAFCLKVLLDEQVFKITGRNANRILMNYEETVMLQDLPPEMGNLHQKREKLEQFASGWAQNTEDFPGTPENEEDKKFQDLVMRWLNSHDAMLIGEVVPLAYQFLKANPTSPYLQKFSNIIVDEYQDLNRVEQELIELLLGQNGEVCIAGDDDQSIYRFRYANPDGIIKFFESADEKITIDVCGRCPQKILDIANRIKELMPNSAKGPMVLREEGVEGEVSLVQWNDHIEEGSGIAAAIKSDIDSGKHEPGDYLVLVQSKDLGIRLRNSIKSLGTDCHSYFQEDPINSSEARRAFTLLMLLVNSHDPVALRFWLGFGDASARREQYFNIRRIMADEKISLDVALETLLSDSKKYVGFRAILGRYVELKKVLANLEDKGVDEIVDILFPEGNEDLDDLRQIALINRQIVGSAKELLSAMVKDITQPGIPETPDFVRVMSLHKSKGLTSKVVIIAGLVEGIVPKAAALVSTEEMEECRRLFYVAVTRAQEELIFSNFSSIPYNLTAKLQITPGRFLRRVDGVTNLRTVTSRFLSELDRVTPNFVRGQDWLESRKSVNVVDSQNDLS